MESYFKKLWESHFDLLNLFKVLPFRVPVTPSPML